MLTKKVLEIELTFSEVFFFFFFLGHDGWFEVQLIAFEILLKVGGETYRNHSA